MVPVSPSLSSLSSISGVVAAAAATATATAIIIVIIAAAVAAIVSASVAAANVFSLLLLPSSNTCHHIQTCVPIIEPSFICQNWL